MATHFGQAAAALLAATDITDDAEVAVRISGPQNGPVRLRDARRFSIPIHTTAKPQIHDVPGFHCTLTGAYRGLYFVTGTEVLSLVPFGEDGSYADAATSVVAFGSASMLSTGTIVTGQCNLFVSGSESGPMTLGLMPVSVVHWRQSSAVITTDAVGFHSVQENTGSNRGLWFNTGSAVHSVKSFTKDGLWPI